MLTALKISHNNQNRIKVDFPYNREVAAILRLPTGFPDRQLRQ